MFRKSRIALSLSCAIVLSSFSGCATFHKTFAKQMPKATPTNPVVEIVCLWQPGEGSDPDGVPCKGFSGQILFLSRTSSTPVPIEGDVRVYLFDDQGTPEEQAKPLRQFDFDNGSWAIHLTDSSFGPTYSVFIPYVRRGVSNADCSLRVRLKPKSGPTVFSDFTNMPLNGQKKAARGDEAKPMNQQEVDRLAADAMSNEIRRTTTISLGPNSKAIDTKSSPKIDANSNQIQLTSHEVESTPAKDVKDVADSERVRKLEAMVKELLEQQGNAGASAGSSTPTRSTSDQNQMLVEPSAAVAPDERLKMSRRLRARQESTEEADRTAPRRRSHPLEDDQPSPSRSQSRYSERNELAQEPIIGDPFDSTVDASPRFSLQDQRYQRY